MNWLKKINPQTAQFWVGTILTVAIIGIFIAAMVAEHYDEKHRQNALRYQLTTLQIASVFEKLDFYLKENDSLPAGLDELVDFIENHKPEAIDQSSDEKNLDNAKSEEEEIKEELAKIGVGPYDDGWGQTLMLKKQAGQGDSPAMLILSKGPNGELGDEDDSEYLWPRDRNFVNRQVQNRYFK